MDQLQAAIDVAADQELFGPAPLELDALEVPCPDRRAEVGVAGFRRPAGVGQRAGEPFPPCLSVRGGRRQCQRVPVEGSRAIERERFAGFSAARPA